MRALKSVFTPVMAVKQLQLSIPLSLLEQPLLIHDNHLELHPLFKPVFNVNKDFSNIVRAAA